MTCAIAAMESAVTAGGPAVENPTSSGFGSTLIERGIDFGVAQAVDGTLGAYGAIPKAFFEKKTPYWTK